MSEVRLVHDAMSRAIAETRAVRQRLSTERRSAQRRVDSFLGSGWQGVANEAFSQGWEEWLESADQVEEGLSAQAQAEAQEEWNEGLAAMRASLADMRQAARIASDNYHLMIATNTGLWRRLT